MRKHAGHKSSKTTFAHYVFKGVPRRRIPSALSLTPEQGLDEEDLRLLLMSMKEVRRQLGLQPRGDGLFVSPEAFRAGGGLPPDGNMGQAGEAPEM